MGFTQRAIHQAELGHIPDVFIKAGIRYLCQQRLNNMQQQDTTYIEENQQERVQKLKNSPIALVPEKANEQHYEVPPRLFELVLGKHLKYSSGIWHEGCDTLDQSEHDMLELTTQRAELQDNMDILELGCGWGSLTFFMAKKYPNAQIVGVSNSKDQKKYIDNKCKEEHITNIQILTRDMNDFTIDKTFDRVVSIEMFEHMRNYQKLLKKIAGFLKKDGKLFVHIFSHTSLVYPYEDNGPSDWMAREFFSGGLMPSHTLFQEFQDDLTLVKDRKVSGIHYKKTSYAWLENMDNNKDEVISLFKETYGDDASLWFHRWRIFFMACGEMFGMKNGNEWGVSHYLFEK